MTWRTGPAHQMTYHTDVEAALATDPASYIYGEGSFKSLDNGRLELDSITVDRRILASLCGERAVVRLERSTTAEMLVEERRQAKQYRVAAE